MKNAQSDLVLSEEELTKFAALLARLGEVEMSEHMQISRTSVLRLLSRRPGRLGTLSLARIGLTKAP